MNLFLTGGTGFFGRALIRHWCKQSGQGVMVPRVTLLTRSAETFQVNYPQFADLAWLEIVTGDILELNSFPKGRVFSHVLHAATDSTLGPQLTALERYQQILDGTKNVLDYAVCTKAKRFLLTSSGGVYGPQPSDLAEIPEDFNQIPDPLVAANTYSIAKRAAEHLCALYQDSSNLEVIIARCFAFVGEDLPLEVHFAIGNFIRDALWSNQVTIKGDGTAIRSYLDQRDLAQWLLVMLEKGQTGKAYNLGSDQAVSIRQLAELVRDTVAPNKEVKVLSKPTSTIRNRYVPNISRAKAELNLKVSITLAEAIEHTVNSINIRASENDSD